ncbi:hypothetical protein ON010_g18408 [Phytophthora cinnamomi]|nr:hypothetical protein ON010_g18408 [Phytophthora cinnamomi]
MLTSGGSIELDRVVRRDKRTGQQAEVACPRVLKDNQTLMGGVDVHDQLRLQRYSLQLAIECKKYYKSLFLGLIDLAVINAYIVFNARRTADGLKKMSHGDDMEEATPSKDHTKPQRAGHRPVQNDECTDDARGGDSSIYCSGCKLTTSSKKPMSWRVFLCDKVRHRHNGALMSCFEIWHKAWRNGTLLPKRAQKKNIRARMPVLIAEGENAEVDDSMLDNAYTEGDQQRPPKHGRTVEPTE